MLLVRDSCAMELFHLFWLAGPYVATCAGGLELVWRIRAALIAWVGWGCVPFVVLT